MLASYLFFVGARLPLYGMYDFTASDNTPPSLSPPKELSKILLNSRGVRYLIPNALNSWVNDYPAGTPTYTHVCDEDDIEMPREHNQR